MEINWRAQILGFQWISGMLGKINWKLEHIMSTLQERFDAINAKLDTTSAQLTEASGEILAELKKLRDGGDLTPEQEASLAAIESKVGTITDAATALANVSPPVPPTP